MKLEEFLVYVNQGLAIHGGSEIHLYMTGLAHEAMRITAELNGAYHGAEEIRILFSKLIGKPVDKSFGIFPPFYTDCGKNITIGKNIFINSGCHFQDQGGITIRATLINLRPRQLRWRISVALCICSFHYANTALK